MGKMLLLLPLMVVVVVNMIVLVCSGCYNKIP